ncbi:putative cyclic nucleotide-binding domain, rmlC-like jelly roll [Plasmopara halstedii]
MNCSRISENVSLREHPIYETPGVQTTLRHILLLPESARCEADYKFLDNYGKWFSLFEATTIYHTVCVLVQRVKFFRELPFEDRLKFLKAAKGIELGNGEVLFRIGDRADTFYCIMFGTMSVVMDFSRMAAPTLNEFEEIMNRARVQSSLLNPGGRLNLSHDATYVVRTITKYEVFGDVGMLLEGQQRTASVVAAETTLLLHIDRDTFLTLRARKLSRELREKTTFLKGVACFDQWGNEAILSLCDRMVRIDRKYNDVIIAEGEPASAFFFVKHGDCRLVKRYSALERKKKQHDRRDRCYVEISTISSQHYFGFYEAILGVANAVFSVLVSSPSTILYRIDRVDFRQLVLKDATTQRILHQEVIDLSARADTRRVMLDLKRDANWNQYKQKLVGLVVSRREEERIPFMGPRPNLCGNSLAREPHFCLPQLPVSLQNSQSEREVPGVSSGRLRRARKPLLNDLKFLSPRRIHENDGS